jgi:hypothetical protein
VTSLTLTLEGGPETDAQDIQQWHQSLRRDLLMTNVESVEAAKADVPKGSKSGLAIDWNTLLITLASGGTLVTVIKAVQAWVLRNQACSVTLNIDEDTLTIDGPGPYSEQQQAAIDQWLARHKGYELP